MAEIKIRDTVIVDDNINIYANTIHANTIVGYYSNTAVDQEITNKIAAHASNTNIHLTPTINTFLTGINITANDINSLSGVSGNIQDQLNALHGTSTDSGYISQKLALFSILGW